LLVLGMGDRHVLADRADAGVEDRILDLLVDLELGGERLNHVAPVVIVARNCFDFPRSRLRSW
jgi:hypothetical protein